MPQSIFQDTCTNIQLLPNFTTKGHDKNKLKLIQPIDASTQVLILSGFMYI